jgi:hypothetical protein
MSNGHKDVQSIRLQWSLRWFNAHLDCQRGKLLLLNKIAEMKGLRHLLALRFAAADLQSPWSQQAAAFAKSAKSKPVDYGSSDDKLQIMLRALESQTVEPLDLTPEEREEAARRAKEYSSRKMRQHREWQADLSMKLKLKQAAIAALPPDLRAAAMVPDLEPFPLNRWIWTETPPVEEEEDAGARRQDQRQQRTGRRALGTKRR